MSAITDVQEAQAGYDLAIAQEIQAINTVDNAKEEVRELTGEYIDKFDGLGESIMLVKPSPERSEEHTSELQSLVNLVCRLLLEKKNIKKI